jgi:hypothetical protein
VNPLSLCPRASVCIFQKPNVLGYACVFLADSIGPEFQDTEMLLRVGHELISGGFAVLGGSKAETMTVILR